MLDRTTPEQRDGLLAVALTRRRLLRAGIAVAALPGALGAGAVLGGARAGRAESTPVTGVATPATDEGSQYRPQETVASPEPQVAGPAVGEETVGPPLADVDPAAAERVAPFLALSTALVGGGRLDPRRAVQYLAIAGADPAKTRALDELLALAASPEEASPAVIATPVAAASDEARALGREILAFWYLGVVGDRPVTERGDAWFGLSAWQAVGYTPAPSACKAFGGWADAPPPQG